MEPLRRDAARTRERIVEAARVLAGNGESLGLNAVARMADVGVGTVYRHFATVPELEEALVWGQFDALEEVLRSASPDQLERVFFSHFALLVEDPLFEKVTSRATPALERTAQMRDSLIRNLGELMSRAEASGHIRPGVTASDVVLLLCGIAHSARAAQAEAGSPQSRFLLNVMFEGLQSAGPRNVPGVR